MYKLRKRLSFYGDNRFFIYATLTQMYYCLIGFKSFPLYKIKMSFQLNETITE